jgi:hypothetical protein
MSSFEEHVAGQHPFQPDHPDFERLREVVGHVEAWQRQGIAPEKAYEKFMDLYSVTYLAVNRTRANVPSQINETRGEFAANSWVEGFLFGLLFQRKGGHRE